MADVDHKKNRNNRRQKKRRLITDQNEKKHWKSHEKSSNLGNCEHVAQNG